jgi:hypothetical protein
MLPPATNRPVSYQCVGQRATCGYEGVLLASLIVLPGGSGPWGSPQAAGQTVAEMSVNPALTKSASVTTMRPGTSTSRVSVSTVGEQGDGISFAPVISGNGRYVAFESTAPNLVPDDTNNTLDVFVRDRRTGVTDRISVSSTGAQADESSFDAAISANGR